MLGSRRQREKLIARFAETAVPDWVSHFRGPFEDPGCSKAQVVRELFAAGDGKVAFLQMAERYMDEHLSNIAVPTVGYSNGKAEVKYSLLIGDPADAARLAAENPAKDPGNFPFPVESLPMQPDVSKWQAQRQQVTDAFLPRASLAGMVPVLQDGVSELICRWGRLGVVEAHRELHHAALDLFIRALCGLRGILPSDPEASAEVREAFNLEAIPNPAEVLRTMPVRADFVQQVLGARVERPGPLLERLRGIADPAARFAETAAFLVAGHDTTAHTLQWALLELARHPSVQEACRAEAESVLAPLEAEGRSLTYEDLPRFEATTSVLAEVLRLWGPAWFVFGRQLTADAWVRGLDGPAIVPAGTAVNFWFYGHHHSRALWGQDACEFRPFHRGFTDEELQRNSSRTPCSHRYHPFSMPSRDCIGKNFSLMEMRLLLPQVVRHFRISLAEPSASAVRHLSFGHGEVFLSQARHPGPIKPPPGGELWLSLSPRSPVARL